MPEITVLYNGWPLARAANSPAALHLLALLENLPDGMKAIVALPEAAPAWIPEDIPVEVRPTEGTAGGQLRWQQRVLPILAKELGANLLHSTTEMSALVGGPQAVISPSGFGVEERPSRSFTARLRDALARGGASRAALLWPQDVPLPDGARRAFKLPPIVGRGFVPPDSTEPPVIPGLEVPETYVLYHGPRRADILRKMLASWTWPSGSLGELFPLLLVGLDEQARADAEKLIVEYNLADSVQILPWLLPEHLSALHRGCSAVFHPASEPVWGGPVRHALACARPVITLQSAGTDALVGPAGYVLPDGDTRTLGAAVLSVLVKENLAEELTERAKARRAAWEMDGFRAALGGVYSKLAFKEK